jgi:hypothetical protein
MTGGALRRFRDWRRAGESGAVAIYRHPRFAFWFYLTVIVLFFLFWKLLGVLFGLVTLPFSLAQWRRALILTADEMIYRPQLGPIHRFAFRDIRGLRVIPLADSDALLGSGIRLQPGIEILLANGEKFSCSLESTQWRDSLDRLSKATGQQIDMGRYKF